MSKSVICNKGRSLEAIPPTHDALLQHMKRAIYQASCWRQSLIAQQNLPDPNAWVGIKKKMVDFRSSGLQFRKLPLYVANSFAAGVTQKKDVKDVANARNLP